MSKQYPQSHAGPAAAANTEARYRASNERALAEAAKRPSAHAHGPMPAGQQKQAPTANNVCHYPK